MKSLKKLFVISVYLLGLLTLAVLSQDSEPIYLFCNNTANFTRNVDFEKNRDLLLSSLTSNANNASGFYNNSAGNQVYGLFLCRGDVSTDFCQDCVTTATRRLPEFCSVQKEVIIWYDECFLRYSHRYIFSTLETRPATTLFSPLNMTTPRSSFLLEATLREAVTKAERAPQGSKRFAVREQNLSDSLTFYTLVQCTPDLSISDCRSCLDDVIRTLPYCCAGKDGGRVLTPSCNTRFEYYQFYNATAAKTLSTAPPSALKEKSRISTLSIIAIVAAAVVLLILVSAGYYCLSNRVKKKRNSLSEDNAANDIMTPESLQYEFGIIETATQMFSNRKKLGRGGFGEVYKGVLLNGQEIAVKRLSTSSKQGDVEFKNEAMLLAKLQHRNLVRLLGFCLAGEEKLLVYEFVPMCYLVWSLNILCLLPVYVQLYPAYRNSLNTVIPLSLWALVKQQTVRKRNA